MRPDHPVMRRIQQVVVGGEGFGLALHSRGPGLQHLPQALHDVADLAFRVEDDAAAMGQVRAGTIQHEHVREAWRGDAQIGPRLILPPQAAHADAIAPGDLHRRQHALGVEPGRQHQDIRRMRHPVAGHDRVGGDPLHRAGYQIDVRAGQHLVPMIVAQHPLAVGRIGRHDLGQQFGIVADLPLDIGDQVFPELLVGRVQRLVRRRPGRIGVQRRMQPVGRRPQQLEPVPLRIERDELQRRRFPLAHILMIVRIGHGPVRGPLEDRQMRDIPRDRGCHLHPGRAGADHRHALAGQIDALVPARGVERRPGEVRQPGNVRDLRLVELPDRGDEGIRLDRFSRSILLLDRNQPLA